MGATITLIGCDITGGSSGTWLSSPNDFQLQRMCTGTEDEMCFGLADAEMKVHEIVGMGLSSAGSGVSISRW